MARMYVPSASAWYKHLIPCVCTRFLRRGSGQLLYVHAQGVARMSFARASYPGRPSPGGMEYSYYAAGSIACTCLVHLHGINTLYLAVSVYSGMHKTLEAVETLALRARVSKPVSAVLKLFAHMHALYPTERITSVLRLL